MWIIWRARIFPNKHYDMILLKTYALFRFAIAKKQRGRDFMEHGVHLKYVIAIKTCAQCEVGNGWR